MYNGKSSQKNGNCKKEPNGILELTNALSKI